MEVGMVVPPSLDFAIIRTRTPDINSDRTAAELFNALAGILQSPPCCFQEPALLRIEPLCFAWRNAKKCRVEFVRIVNKTRPAAVAHTYNGGIWMVERAPAPPGLGDLINEVARLRQRVPESGRLFDASGQTAADSNDGQRLSCTRHGPASSMLGSRDAWSYRGQVSPPDKCGRSDSTRPHSHFRSASWNGAPEQSNRKTAQVPSTFRSPCKQRIAIRRRWPATTCRH